MGMIAAPGVDAEKDADDGSTNQPASPEEPSKVYTMDEMKQKLASTKDIAAKAIDPAADDTGTGYYRSQYDVANQMMRNWFAKNGVVYEDIFPPKQEWDTAPGNLHEGLPTSTGRENPGGLRGPLWMWQEDEGGGGTYSEL